MLISPNRPSVALPNSTGSGAKVNRPHMGKYSLRQPAIQLFSARQSHVQVALVLFIPYVGLVPSAINKRQCAQAKHARTKAMRVAACNSAVRSC